MRITDLIIDPKSLGEKLWLVDISPAYEYKNSSGRGVLKKRNMHDGTNIICPNSFLTKNKKG